MVTGMIMLGIVLYYQPCLGKGRHLNHHFACMYVMILWTAISSLTAIISNTYYVAEITFVVGIGPCVYAFYKSSIYFQNMKDELLFQECKGFMNPLKSFAAVVPDDDDHDMKTDNND